MMVLAALSGLVAAARAEPPRPGITQRLTDEVTVDWTSLSLEIRARAAAPTVGALQAVEEMARRNVDKAIERALPHVPLTATTNLGEILDGPDLGPPIAARQARWEVVEARYSTSGQVALTATLSLASVVKPWVLDHAVPGEPPERPPFTGVLVDARAIGVTMAVAPRIVSDDGQLVFDGSLDAFSAVTRSPVCYVDSIDEALQRAGDRPWRLLATGTQAGVDLIVADVDPGVVASAEGLLRTGEIVVVVRDSR